MTTRNVPVVFGRDVPWSSENCELNGVDYPCDVYDFADDLGCPPCTHFGADLVVFYENVYSATDGVVTFAGHDPRFYTPLYVTVRPDKGPYKDDVLYYAHLTSIAAGVYQNAYIRRGDLIGKSGTDAPNGVIQYGNEHLHFERRRRDLSTPSQARSMDPNPVLTSANANNGTEPDPVVIEPRIGDRIRIFDGPVNLRATASLSGTVVGSIPLDTSLCVLDGPVAASNLVWVKVTYQSVTGWIASDYARVNMIGGCKSFSVNDQLVVNEDSVSIRRHADRGSTIVGTANEGSKVCVLEGYQAADGYRWYKVDTGVTSGWAAATYLNLHASNGCGALDPDLIPTTGIVPGDVLSVSASSVNLREIPKTGTTVIAALPNGTKVAVVGGPATADGYTWYQVEAKTGRGWVISSSMAEVTPTNLLANPGATSNVIDIAAMSVNSTVTREAFQGGHVVKVVNTGASNNEGVKYNSGTLSLAGQRGFVAVFDTFGRAKLDQVKLRVMYSDGSGSTYSDAAIATTLSTGKWQRLVTPVVLSNAAKTVNRVELWIRRGPAAAQTFYVDNAKIIEV